MRISDKILNETGEINLLLNKMKQELNVDLKIFNLSNFNRVKIKKKFNKELSILLKKVKKLI